MKLIPQKRAMAALAGAGALMYSGLTYAAINVDAVKQEITDTLGPIGTIGAAVLLVVVSIAAFRWVRRAI